MKTLDHLRENGLLATEINKFESRLWRASRRDGLKTILITSAVRGEGKSTTAAYLATSLGLYPGRRVLAIDFDFRVPMMNEHFGLRIPVGIDKVLEGKATLTEAIIKTELPGLHVAMPSPGGADHTLLQRTQDLTAMLTTLRDNYDLILMDTPAIIPVADPTRLIPYADGVILAAMAGKTTGPQLARAKEICEGLDANILGLIVNNIEEAAPDYLAGDYDYGYHAPVREAEEDAGFAPPLRSNGPRKKKKPSRHG